MHKEKPFTVKMTPLISFIIAYHNEPDALLKACLDSIHALPLEKDEAEILVVDDGSETPATSLCLPGGENISLPSGKFGGGRYIRQAQAGLSVARNTGISHAQGRYIQFVDADDCLIPPAYEAVIEQLRKGKADVVMFRMTKKQQNKFTIHNTQKKLPSEGKVWRGAGTSFLLHCNLRAAACAYAFRRETLGDLRFYPGLYHEDELFTPLLFLRAKSICDLDIAAYFYRQHSGTITHSVSQEKAQNRLNDIHFIINGLNNLGEPTLDRRIQQLTVDYLQKTWTLTSSFQVLRKRIRELRDEGLLPLPLRRYSLRYLFVATIANLL